MFNDRDLGVLGAGALLAVLCLVLPLPFIGKIILGLSALVGFIVLALLRLGPDRIPIEEWLRRRIRFRLQARRYTFQQPGYPQNDRCIGEKQRAQTKVREPEEHTFPSAQSRPMETFRPLSFGLDEIGIYPLVTVLLAVIGIYFLVWLAQGGLEEIARLIGGLFL
jgi:nitrate reductase NapE component